MKLELHDAQQRAEREAEGAAKTLSLEREIAGLKRELDEARSNAYTQDVCLQVETEDVFDLRRALQQSEEGKIAAEAYSIQTKAALARAEHASKGIAEELMTWKQQCKQDLEHAHQTTQIAREEACQKLQVREARVQQHFHAANQVLYEQLRQVRETIRSICDSAANCNGTCMEDVSRLSLQVDKLQTFDFKGELEYKSNCMCQGLERNEYSLDVVVVRCFIVYYCM